VARREARNHIRPALTAWCLVARLGICLQSFRSCCALLGLATACGDFITTLPTDQRNRSVSVQVGEELDVILGNVGPGFDEVPEISSPILRFIDVSVIPPYVPSGPNQKYRFVAVAKGTVVVTFRSLIDRQSEVQDTVIVR
jgi:hypothetical protein